MLTFLDELIDLANENEGSMFTLKVSDTTNGQKSSEIFSNFENSLSTSTPSFPRDLTTTKDNESSGKKLLPCLKRIWGQNLVIFLFFRAKKSGEIDILCSAANVHSCHPVSSAGEGNSSRCKYLTRREKYFPKTEWEWWPSSRRHRDIRGIQTEESAPWERGYKEWAHVRFCVGRGEAGIWPRLLSSHSSAVTSNHHPDHSGARNLQTVLYKVLQGQGRVSLKVRLLIRRGVNVVRPGRQHQS